jgi:hypothetical protein
MNIRPPPPIIALAAQLVIVRLDVQRQTCGMIYLHAFSKLIPLEVSKNS